MSATAGAFRLRLRALLAALDGWPRGGMLALCTGLLAGLGYLDFTTGWEISLSVFYLLPIGLASWYLGRWGGSALAAVGAMLSSAGDVVAGISFSHPLIPVWNGLVRFAGFLVIVIVLDELRHTLRAATGLARSDPLTGLANARAFNEHAVRIAAESARYGRPVALAFLDLDGLKAINDSLGHTAGDLLLCLAADTMTGGLRASDLVARLGGDEFAILLPETDLVEASAAIAKLQAAFAGTAQHAGYTARMSAGIVACDRTPPTIQPLLARADQLMYAAKHGGTGLVAERFVAPARALETPAGPATGDAVASGRAAPRADS